MTILLADPRVRAVPVLENHEALVALTPRLGTAVLVRAEVARRLELADGTLPRGFRLRVVEGYRSVADQERIIASYSAEVRREHPSLDEAEVQVLTSRFVSPLDVAPHVAGAAVDVLLTDELGSALDLGCPLDATPEQSNGACYFDAVVTPEARHHRDVLARAMTGAGFVNYPTEWWHWSFGDRYWALVSGAPAARYGPCSEAP